MTFVDRSNLWKKRRDTKILRQQESKMVSDVHGCTFAPKIVSFLVLANCDDSYLRGKRILFLKSRRKITAAGLIGITLARALGISPSRCSGQSRINWIKFLNTTRLSLRRTMISAGRKDGVVSVCKKFNYFSNQGRLSFSMWDCGIIKRPIKYEGWISCLA